MHNGFIDDGYTEDGYMVEEPGLHQAVRFTFRPMLSTEYAVLLKSMMTNDFPRIRKDYAEAVAKHVKSWDIRNSKDEPVTVTAANAMKFKESMLCKLFLIVSCQIPSDGADQPTDTDADAKN